MRIDSNTHCALVGMFSAAWKLDLGYYGFFYVRFIDHDTCEVSPLNRNT